MKHSAPRSVGPYALGLMSLSVACGDRTALAPLAEDDTGAGTPVAALPNDAGEDPCPSAVLSRAGSPMPDNCSTRDGRSRVAAPASPHLLWSEQIAPGNFGLLGADADGSVYVSTSVGSSSAQGDVLTRVDATTGTIVWSTRFAGGISSTPLLLASGAIDVIEGSNTQAFDTVSPTTGAGTPTNVAPAGNFNVLTSAIGEDGSFYFVGGLSTDASVQALGIERMRADGTVVWQTGNVSPPNAPDLGEYTQVALGAGDEVAIAVTTDAQTTSLLAFEPTTGESRWSVALPGAIQSGPTAAPDGTFSILLGPNGLTIADAGMAVTLASVGADGTTIALLDASAAAGTDLTIYRMDAVARDGTVILVAGTTNGSSVILAFDRTRGLLWQTPVGSSFKTTIDTQGTVVAYGRNEIDGLSLATGKALWKVASVGTAVIEDATLTSSGQVVAIEQDGTLFAAGD